MNLLQVTMMAVVLHNSKCAVPGSFFWKPRMTIDLRAADKPTEQKYAVLEPSLTNMRNGKVVIINGYGVGMSVIALSTVGMRTMPKYPQMDVFSADFYTTAYRWVLRALSLIPEWVAGPDAKYAETQRVWRRRFHFMESQVPQWMRSILFYVDDWGKEEAYEKKFNMHARASFDKHLRYPSKKVEGDFDSFANSKETVENLDDSESVA